LTSEVGIMESAVINTSLHAEYAAGNLGRVMSLVVACHADLNPEARKEISLFEGAAGEMLEHTGGVPVSQKCWESLCARLDDTQPIKPGSRIVLPWTPAPLQHFMAANNIHDLRWRRYGTTLRICNLLKEGEASCHLIAVAPGKKLPRHTHKGLEMVLVLQGGMRDGRGEFLRGDMAVSDESIEHTPETLPGEECICLVATHGDVKFTGRLGSLLNLLT
jgi:putative transcriptional regulator